MKKSQIIIAVALSSMLLIGCKHKEKEKSLPDYSETPLTVDTYRELVLAAKEAALGEGATLLDDVTVRTSLTNTTAYKKDSFWYEKGFGVEKSVFFNADEGKYYDYEHHSVFTSSNHYREIELDTFNTKMATNKEKIANYFVTAFDVSLAILNGTSEEYVNPTIKFAKLSGGRKEMIVKAKYTTEVWDAELESNVEEEKTKTLTIYIKNNQLTKFEEEGGTNNRQYEPTYGGASYAFPAKPEENGGE